LQLRKYLTGDVVMTDLVLQSKDAGTEQRNRWLLVAVVGLAVFMANVDLGIVNVAMPSIQLDLGTQPDVTQWVALGYFLPMIVLALPSGRWLDQVGKRAALGFAASGFGLASIACALSPNIGVLIAARVTQGVFGAVLFAMTPVLATFAVRPEARGRAMSVVTTMVPMGAVSGPALGGVLVGHLGWEWIFYVNIPVCFAVILLGLNQIPAAGSLRLPGRDWLVEAVLLGSSVSMLMVGLALTARHGLGSLMLSALALLPLWIWSRLPVSEPSRNILRSSRVLLPLTALMTTMTAVGLTQYLTPFFLSQVLRLSPGQVGATVLAFAVGMAASATVSGAVCDRWGPAAPQLIGSVLSLIGLVLMVSLDGTWGPLDVVWRLALFGVGHGLFAAPNQSLVMSSAPKPMLGTLGASSALVRQLGLSLGPAVATITWSLSGYRTAGMAVAFVIGAVAILVAGLSVIIRGDQGTGESPQVARSTSTC
jgi:MFS family permease